MQQNPISKIFLLVLIAVIALGITMQIFTSQGNVLGNSFRYITPLAMLVGLLAPRMGFYLLLLAGAYLDAIKRFMVLDSNFSDVDLAFMLSFAPAIVAGMVLKFVLAMFITPEQVSRREIILFISITILCSAMGGAQLMMDGGIRNMGNAVNMVAYLYMPLLLPRIFKNLSDIRTLMIATMVIYVPAALWAWKQAQFGLAKYEMDYLLSGMTIEIRQLDEEIFRNMGTMVSAHALSMITSILTVALLIPVLWKNGKITPKTWLNPLRWVFATLFVIGAYFTFSRTGWACAMVAILTFIILQSRILTFASFFTVIISVTTLYLSAEYILEERLIAIAHEFVMEKAGNSPELRQALVLGTLEARLESMAAFVNEPTLWSKFGLRGQQHNAKWVHDILTETLVKIGYIPLFTLVGGFLVGAFFSFRALFKMPRGPHRTFATYFAALGIGLCSGGFSQGVMILYYPINLFWCMFLGLAFTCYFWWRESLKATVMVEQEYLTPLKGSPSPASVH